MMPELGSIHIRRMLPGDFDQVISLRAKYRQQLGIGALNTLWKLDPEGIFVAVTEDGKVQGSVIVVTVSSGLSYVCLHTVQPELHRRGLGKKLWNAVEERLGTDRNAFLICGAFDVSMYLNRFKFQVVSPVTIHYIRPGRADVSTLTEDVPGVNVADVTASTTFLTSQVVDYDEAVSGYRRERLLSLMLQEPGNVTKVALTKGSVVGYGIVSTDISGCALLRVVYADGLILAERLVRSLLEGFQPFVDDGVTGLLLAGAGELTGLEVKMSLETIPCVKMLYRHEEPATCDYGRQYVVCV